MILFGKIDHRVLHLQDKLNYYYGKTELFNFLCFVNSFVNL